jgi:hypothetical protein
MIQSYKQELSNNTEDEDEKTKIIGLKVNVLCSVGNPFGFINGVIRKDFVELGVKPINMFFIVGRDRADFFDNIVKAFKNNDNVYSIDGLILDRKGMTELKNIGMGERNIKDIDLSEYSASFVRNLVKNKQRNEFNEVYSPYLNTESIEKLYNVIENGIKMRLPPSKEDDVNIKSIYYDNPDNVENIDDLEENRNIKRRKIEENVEIKHKLLPVININANPINTNAINENIENSIIGGKHRKTKKRFRIYRKNKNKKTNKKQTNKKN